MFEAATPPACWKFPPAYKAAPVPSSKTRSDRTVPTIPDPRGFHPLPSHLAMPGADWLPAVRKFPPAYKAGPLPSSKISRA
jgi:hypothetical protein